MFVYRSFYVSHTKEALQADLTKIVSCPWRFNRTWAIINPHDLRIKSHKVNRNLLRNEQDDPWEAYSS